MSDLLRQSVNGQPPPVRPRPTPIATPAADIDDYSSSSDSSASSAASVATVRPTSREYEAGPTHWTHYFEQELFLEHESDGIKAVYHVFLTPPTNVTKGPLFICHHGAGASALSFAVFAADVRSKLPAAGILSLEARGHGSTVVNPADGREILDYSLEALVADAIDMIGLTASKMGWPQLPPTVLIGHSLGGAVVTSVAASRTLSAHPKLFGSNLVGYVVLDVVEGSALEALAHMKTYISSRPKSFASADEAIAWHIRSRTIRDQRSAEASVPALLGAAPSGDRLVWRTRLSDTAPFWEAWFQGMSPKFLTGRGAKMLILAGTDRLDRELMIGQMQGKFQLVVIPEAGHFVHEDVPEKTAGLIVEFFRRNDRSQMVLPPKVSDLIAQGKKV